jgi:ABC-type histidine transport system ATPase subunit
VAITVGAGCNWTVTTNATWITVTNGVSGSGSGSTEFVIAVNLIGSRTGTVTVAGQTVTVNQNGIGGLASSAPVGEGKQ